MSHEDDDEEPTAEQRLLEIAGKFTPWPEPTEALASEVKVAALRYAAEVLAAFPRGQVTSYGLVCQALEVAAQGLELPQIDGTAATCEDCRIASFGQCSRHGGM